MSFINPTKVAVNVYRSSDANAPKLDKTANCLATILKACLVTGYGTKSAAGWTMPFEDTAADIKVLRPEVGTEQDFYLKLSSDTGRYMTAQVYTDMTSTTAGNLKLQCAYPFNYGAGDVSGKWMVIATSRSFWLLVERNYNGYTPKPVINSGSWFFCGDVSKNTSGNRAVYLHHSGDTDLDGSNNDILKSVSDSGETLVGKIIDDLLITRDAYPIAQFDGRTALTTDLFLAPLYIINNSILYQLPGIYAPSNGAKNDNFTLKNVSYGTDSSDFAVMDMNAYNIRTNFYFKLDNWVY